MRRHSKNTRFCSEAIHEPNSRVLACVSRLAPRLSAITPIIPSGRIVADLVDREGARNTKEYEEHVGYLWTLGGGVSRLTGLFVQQFGYLGAALRTAWIKHPGYRSFLFFRQ